MNIRKIPSTGVSSVELSVVVSNPNVLFVKVYPPKETVSESTVPDASPEPANPNFGQREIDYMLMIACHKYHRRFGYWF